MKVRKILGVLDDEVIRFGNHVANILGYNYAYQLGEAGERMNPDQVVAFLKTKIPVKVAIAQPVKLTVRPEVVKVEPGKPKAVEILKGKPPTVATLCRVAAQQVGLTDFRGGERSFKALADRLIKFQESKRDDLGLGRAAKLMYDLLILAGYAEEQIYGIRDGDYRTWSHSYFVNLFMDYVRDRLKDPCENLPQMLVNAGIAE